MLSDRHSVRHTLAHIPHETISRDALLELSPWLSAWLGAPQASPTPRAHRNFIKTPFALGLLDIAPSEAHFLDDCLDPWRAFQAIVRAYYSRDLLRLSAGSSLQHAIIVNDLQAVAEQARRAQLHDLSVTTFAAPGSERAAGHTALTLAALLGRNHAVDCLLAAGAAVDSRDALGNTALHWAQLTRNAALRDTLLAHGAPTEATNRLGAQPVDCDEAWNALPPTELSVLVERRDGRRLHLTDIASFRACLGFEYQPRLRLGIDFALQLAVGQTSAAWMDALHYSLSEHPPMSRTAVTEPALLFRDDGAPWGWNVCAGEALPRGSWVAAYTGDLIHSHESLVELLNHGSNPHLSQAHVSGPLQSHLQGHIDALRNGGFGSRIPTSAARANLTVVKGFWRGLPRYQFIAERDIAAGERLFAPEPAAASQRLLP